MCRCHSRHVSASAVDRGRGSIQIIRRACRRALRLSRHLPGGSLIPADTTITSAGPDGAKLAIAHDDALTRACVSMWAAAPKPTASKSPITIVTPPAYCNLGLGSKPRLTAEQLAQFAQIVEAGPDRKVDGVVRWRRIDLKGVTADRFGVDFHPRYVGKKLGFSHISARPLHPAQDERIIEAFKNVWPAPSARGLPRSASDQSASTYPASKGLLPAMMEIRALRAS